MRKTTMFPSLLFSLLTLSFAAAASLSSSPTAIPDSQQPLKPQDAIFRDLEDRDVPAITSLIIAAFSPGLMYHYIAPAFALHEPEIWHCMNESLTESWSTRNRSTTLGKVIAVDDIPVSVAVWNLRSDDSNVSQTYHIQTFVTFTNCASNPGLNSTRNDDYERQIVKILNGNFFRAYDRQLYLNMLATHPEWDGHGFAARLVDWGLKLSRQLSSTGWPVTLLGTPAGWPLYDSLGFESVANVTISMLEEVDGQESLWFEVMRWDEE